MTIHILSESSQLPILPTGVQNLYMDLETSSGDPKLDSLDPWRNCKIAGIALTYDDCPDSWYVPIGHAQGRNLFRDPVQRWLREIVSRSHRWVNHHVKYDMHVLKNDLGLDPPDHVRCTIASSQTIDSDRIYKGGYGLEALSRTWLHREGDSGKQTAAIAPYTVGSKNKDYGRVPIDVLGPYACQDVFLCRDLDLHCEKMIPEQSHIVHQTEQALTLALWDMERRGMRIDMTELKTTELITMIRMLAIDEELHRLTGMSLRPHVNADCHELLCIKYGLPVLAWTEGDNDKHTSPSFDKHALRGYLNYPGAPIPIVKLLLEYRNLHTLMSLFITTYQELQIDSILHPRYNQMIKTFRMSCGKPNAQQLSKAARALIHPGPGRAFVSIDMSQIEFRLIVHYLKNQTAIAAYAKDADTDFHAWVAKMCGVARSPAKNINFMMGYGGGRAKVLSMLSTNMDLVGSLNAIVDGLISEGKLTDDKRKGTFDVLAKRRAEMVYDEYHQKLPELKATSKNMALVCERRGYVYNAHGRRLYGPPELAWRSFNKVIQSEAAEVMKERTVAVAPRYCEELRKRDVHIVASVHDETLFDVPEEVLEDRDFLWWLRSELCNTNTLYRVPMRASVGVSRNRPGKAGNWCEAAKDEKTDISEFLGPYETKRLPTDEELANHANHE